jgi:hypothetical protein
MWHALEAERTAQDVNFHLADMLPHQLTPATERGVNHQPLITDINPILDDGLFNIPFDDLPDYFWGDWTFNG